MASSMSGVIRSKRPQLRVVATLFAAGAAVAACRADAATIVPNGTYTYEIAERGKAEATSTIVVTRTPSEIVVTEHSSPMEAAEITRRTFDAATFVARTYANEVSGHAYTTVTIDGNTGVLEQGGRKTTFSAPADAPLAVFDANVASAFQLPALLHAVPSHRATLISLFFGTSTIVLTAAPSTAARPPRVPAADVATDVSVDGKPATLWYDPVSYVLDEFDIPAVGFAFVLTSRSDATAPLP